MKKSSNAFFTSWCEDFLKKGKYLCIYISFLALQNSINLKSESGQNK